MFTKLKISGPKQTNASGTTPAIPLGHIESQNTSGAYLDNDIESLKASPAPKKRSKGSILFTIAMAIILITTIASASCFFVFLAKFDKTVKAQKIDKVIQPANATAAALEIKLARYALQYAKKEAAEELGKMISQTIEGQKDLEALKKLPVGAAMLTPGPVFPGKEAAEFFQQEKHEKAMIKEHDRFEKRSVEAEEGPEPREYDIMGYHIDESLTPGQQAGSIFLDILVPDHSVLNKMLS